MEPKLTGRARIINMRRDVSYRRIPCTGPLSHFLKLYEFRAVMRYRNLEGEARTPVVTGRVGCSAGDGTWMVRRDTQETWRKGFATRYAAIKFLESLR